MYSNSSQAIDINIGQIFIVTLNSNPTTGFTWVVEFDDSFLELVESRYEPSVEAKGGLVGAGGTRIFGFKALMKGKTELMMVLKRPWEEDYLQHKVFTVTIS